MTTRRPRHLSAAPSGSQAVAALLVLCLSGCTPQLAAAPPAPLSTPAPTATIAAGPSLPQPVLPLTCEELLPQAAIARVFADEIPLELDSTRQVSTLVEAVVRTEGGTKCEWGTHPDGNGERSSLELTIAPNAADAYRKFILENELVEPRRCARTAEAALCIQHMLVEDYWLDVLLRLAGTYTDDQLAVHMDEALAVITPALIDAIASVEEAGDAAEPAGDALVLGCGSEALATLLRDAFSEQELSFAGYDWDGGAYNELMIRAELEQCLVMAGEKSLRLYALPHGAWAIDSLAVTLEDGVQRERVEINGADAATVACADSHCRVHLAVRGSLVELTAEGWARNEVLQYTGALLAGLT